MKKIKIYFVQLIWHGLLQEFEPTITANEEEAFQGFTDLVVDECGFRSPKEGETFEQYREAFFTFEYKYRNEYDEVTDEEKGENITDDPNWDPDEHEILYHEKEIEIPGLG